MLIPLTDLSLVGAVGVFGEQTAAARALEPGHLSAQERLQRLEEPTSVSQQILNTLHHKTNTSEKKKNLYKLKYCLS